MERYPNDEYEEVCEEHVPHENRELEDRHFAYVYAFSLRSHGVNLTEALCRQWITEGFVTADEMELIKKEYEELGDG